MIYDLISAIRPKTIRPVVRFEGLAGEFSQHDYGHVDVQFLAGTQTRVHFFASRLKYSRWVEVSIVPDERAETLVRTFVDHFTAIGAYHSRPSSTDYTLLGINVEAAVLYTAITAVAEFFYHWNVHTPRWLGPIFQRPESHRVHHKSSYHTNNYADLPVFDIMCGTYENPRAPIVNCGFTGR
jgi:hypothetical protein